jgi:cytochrome c oxidase subunit 2
MKHLLSIIPTVFTGLMLGAASLCLVSCGPGNADPKPTSAAAPAPKPADSANSQGSNASASAEGPGQNTGAGKETVVRLTAKRFEYSPSQITVKRGANVVLELISKDRIHGFNLPDFKIRSDIKPNEVARVRFTPNKTGTFTFACDVYCGGGHEEMSGTLVVVD